MIQQTIKLTRVLNGYTLRDIFNYEAEHDTLIEANAGVMEEVLVEIRQEPRYVE